MLEGVSSLFLGTCFVGTGSSLRRLGLRGAEVEESHGLGSPGRRGFQPHFGCYPRPPQSRSPGLHHNTIVLSFAVLCL